MATFTIDPTTATFRATITNSQDDAGDLERVSLSVYIDSEQEWSNLYTLVSTKYHVHVPLSGSDPVVDVARGRGVGTLTVPGLMTAQALLISLRRSQWLPAEGMTGSAEFLITEIVDE